MLKMERPLDSKPTQPDIKLLHKPIFSKEMNNLVERTIVDSSLVRALLQKDWRQLILKPTQPLSTMLRNRICWLRKLTKYFVNC